MNRRLCFKRRSYYTPISKGFVWKWEADEEKESFIKFSKRLGEKNPSRGISVKYDPVSREYKIYLKLERIKPKNDLMKSCPKP